MMKHEFEELTGMHVPFFLYDRIEKAYYSFGGDKREFCAAYADNANVTRSYEFVNDMLHPMEF